MGHLGGLRHHLLATLSRVSSPSPAVPFTSVLNFKQRLHERLSPAWCKKKKRHFETSWTLSGQTPGLVQYPVFMMLCLASPVGGAVLLRDLRTWAGTVFVTQHKGTQLLELG